MAELFGRRVSREELLRRVGDVSQLGGVRLVKLADGPEAGVRAIDFRTGSGLNFTVLPDRGMDISWAEYKGMSLCWHSATGQVGPWFYEPEGFGWLRSFYGGLLVTCGLTYMGAPGEDPEAENPVSAAPFGDVSKVYLGLHGRASNIPARNVKADGEWRGDDYVMWAEGRIREATVFGEVVELRRRVEAVLGERRLFVKDVVRNIGYVKAPLMILYHINIGFPVVDEGSRLVAPVEGVEPRDEDAERGLSEYDRFSAPVKGFREQVYFLDMRPDPEGFVRAALVNEALGLGVYVKYRKEQLPRFIEWKMMGEGVYVVGMEPANSLVLGRPEIRRRGELDILEPGEGREFALEIGVLEGVDEIREFEASVKGS
ncbi:MAG TPA: DUF4432 family protein [Armatimonadetes bacterium]|nr:DUF4432 family protein [Armatimonadota bacterium]